MLFQCDFEVDLLVALDAVEVVQCQREWVSQKSWQRFGKRVGRALLQTDVVGDFGQGAFALLLEPGVRHCGFLGRGSEANVMEAL